MGASYVASVTDVKADGKDTVLVSLANGNADLPYVLGSYFFAIFPKDFQDWAHPISSGPYTIKSWEPGVRAAGTRFPNYWRSDRAWFDGFELTLINNSTARLECVRFPARSMRSTASIGVPCQCCSRHQVWRSFVLPAACITLMR